MTNNTKIYPSKFAPGTLVSAAQRLAEIMVERQARTKGTELPPYFWRTMKDWERAYRLQLRHANGLLKLYEPKAIGNALRTKEGKRIISLGAKWLDAIIEAEQRKLNAAKAIRDESRIESIDTVASGSPPTERPSLKRGTSVIDKLSEL